MPTSSGRARPGSSSGWPGWMRSGRPLRLRTTQTVACN